MRPIQRLLLRRLNETDEHVLLGVRPHELLGGSGEGEGEVVVVVDEEDLPRPYPHRHSPQWHSGTTDSRRAALEYLVQLTQAA
jgi:hypothetical protein